MNLKTGEISVKHVVHLYEQKREDNRGTKDECIGPLLDGAVRITLQPESNMKQKGNDTLTENSTPREDDTDAAVEAVELEEAPQHAPE